MRYDVQSWALMDAMDIPAVPASDQNAQDRGVLGQEYCWLPSTWKPRCVLHCYSRRSVGPQA